MAALLTPVREYTKDTNDLFNNAATM